MKELTGKDEVRIRQLSGEKRRKLIQLVTVLIKSADRLQQPYVRTQLAIAMIRRKTIIKNPDIKKQEEVYNNNKKNSKASSSSKQIKSSINLQENMYGRTQQVAVRLEKNIIKKKESNKVIITIKHSKTHYKGNSVFQSLLIKRKRSKRERSKPKGVISRLYISSNIIHLVTVLIKSADRLQKPYIRTQLATANAKYCTRKRIKRLTSKYAKRNDSTKENE